MIFILGSFIFFNLLGNLEEAKCPRYLAYTLKVTWMGLRIAHTFPQRNYCTLTSADSPYHGLSENYLPRDYAAYWPVSDLRSQCGYSALSFKMSASCYGYSAPTSTFQWKHCIFKGECNLQNKTWANFCHTFRQIQSSVILLFGPMNLDMKSAPNSRWIDRSETLCRNSLIMTPVTRQWRKVRGWEPCSFSIAAYPKGSGFTPTGLCH